MKKMLSGIFLMLISIWLLIFGIMDQSTILVWGSVALVFCAIIVFVLGFNEKNKT